MPRLQSSVLLILLCVSACSQKPLPVFGEVPDFGLIAETGKPFDRGALTHHVWIADFVFTNCEGPCPRMSSTMALIQDRTPADVRLVSFSVDPTRDTPPVLFKYAQHFRANSLRWSFLTGEANTLNTLDHDVFKLGNVAAGSNGAGLDHSTRFVLVDKKGQIRGYYGLSDGDAAARVAADASRLDKEPA